MPQYSGPFQGGNFSKLNLTTATVVQSPSGANATAVFRVFVNTAGSTAGGIYDASTTAGNTAANLICTIEAAGVYEIVAPLSNGLLFEPGTGMVASLTFS